MISLISSSALCMCQYKHSFFSISLSHMKNSIRLLIFIWSSRCVFSVYMGRKRKGKSKDEGAAWYFSLQRMCYQLDSKFKKQKTELHFWNKLGAIYIRWHFLYLFLFCALVLISERARGYILMCLQKKYCHEFKVFLICLLLRSVFFLYQNPVTHSGRLNDIVQHWNAITTHLIQTFLPFL